MASIISYMLIAFEAIIAIALVVIVVAWFITTYRSNNKNKSSESTLTFKDNLVDTINKNYKPVKDFYEIYVYLNPTSTQKLIYLIHSRSNWKYVFEVNHFTIKVYLKCMPFEFYIPCVYYRLSEHSVGNLYSIDSFVINHGLYHDMTTTLYSDNKNIGYLGIRKINSHSYDVNILQDVGIDRYIHISFNYYRKIKDNKTLDKILKKVLIN